MTPLEIEEAAIHLFQCQPNRRLSTGRELRFGSHGSTSVVLTGDRAGFWFSHEDREGGRIKPDEDPVPHRIHQTHRVPRQFDPSDSADRCIAIIANELCDIDAQQACVRPTDGPTPARLYLQSRGIEKTPWSVRGWIGKGIAFVAQDAQGTALAVQVMHLHPDGSKNTTFWSDGVVKRTYCKMRGWNHVAAVRMHGRGRPIVCEGPETGLSLWLATSRPVLACLGLSGVGNIAMKSKYTFAADRDPPGSKAAAATQRVIAALPEGCDVIMPPLSLTKTDFNDIHKQSGLAAVLEIINGSNRVRRSISQAQDRQRGNQR